MNWTTKQLRMKHTLLGMMMFPGVADKTECFSTIVDQGLFSPAPQLRQYVFLAPCTKHRVILHPPPNNKTPFPGVLNSTASFLAPFSGIPDTACVSFAVSTLRCSVVRKTFCAFLRVLSPFLSTPLNAKVTRLDRFLAVQHAGDT